MFTKLFIRKWGLVILLTGCQFQLWATLSQQLTVDVAIFRYDRNAVFVEIYYQAPPSEMFLRIEKGDSLWTNQSWENVVISEDGQGVYGGENLGRAFFVAPEGEYQIKLESHDKESGKVLLTREFNLSIHPFPEKALSLSDIELATNIQLTKSQSAQNPFIKNSLLVIPNPNLEFGVKQPILFYYLEVYNVLQGLTGDVFYLHATVLDSIGNEVQGVPSVLKKEKRSYDSVVEYGQMGLFSLPSGQYTLKVALLDTLKQELISKTKKFIYVPSVSTPIAPQLSDERFNMSPFSAMEGKELITEYDQAQYLMTGVQKSLYKNLTNDDARRRMLFAFWQNLDTKPETNENEFYYRYKERIQYANNKFSSSFLAGWKTDRGRVYCIYGNPTDIERFPSAAENVPYEIWHYDEIEGGVVFVFSDLTGFNRYTLIHSTKQGETYNTNYMEMVKKGY